MHDDVFHFGVINGPLRRATPRFFGAGVIREHADDIELVEVSELQCLRVFNASTKDKMQFRITQSRFP